MGNVPSADTVSIQLDDDLQENRSPFLLHPYDIPSQPFAAASQRSHRKVFARRIDSVLQRSYQTNELPRMTSAKAFPVVSHQSKLSISSSAHSMTILQQLILIQDWQRVLCRLEIYPDEIHQYMPIYVHSTIPANSSPTTASKVPDVIFVTPLHLVCALDPPIAVVSTMFRIGGAEIASMPVRPSTDSHHGLAISTSKSSLWRRKRKELRRRKNRLASGQQRLLRSRNQSMDLAAESHDEIDNQSHVSNSSSTASFNWNIIRTNTSSSSTGSGNWKLNIRYSFENYRRRLKYAIRHRQSRGGAFPMVEEDDEEESDVLDTNTHVTYAKTTGTAGPQYSDGISIRAGSEDVRVAVFDQCNVSHSSVSSATTPIAGANTPRSADNVILQLSPTGGVHPVPLCMVAACTPLSESENVVATPVDDSNSHERFMDVPLTEEGNVPSTNGEMVNANPKNALFRIHWDFDPLLHHVLLEGNFLALHIACLYSASSEVLSVLLEAYPMAALYDVVGMLPIHFIAAGWSIPPLLPPPPSIVLQQLNESTPINGIGTAGTKGPMECLKALQHVVPDSVRIRSGNHGMTPEEYIQECMYEGAYKESCLRLLHQDLSETSQDGTRFFDVDTSMSNSSDSLLSFHDPVNSSSEDVADSGTQNDRSHAAVSTSTIPCLSSLVVERDWEQILMEVERQPSLAAIWMFGIDDASARVYKRLPLHCCCAFGAPFNLIASLVKHYPDGASATDPTDMSTPLALACFAGASMEVIQLLLHTYPMAISIENVYGQVPLHIAVLSKLPYAIIELLVENLPDAVLLADNDKQTPIQYAKKIYGEKHKVYQFLIMIQIVLRDNGGA
jgi:hypothetical protein